jgi:hypothetical protein
MYILSYIVIFIVSGNSGDWYWRGINDQDRSYSFKRLLRYNWGSVVAGSFLNAFLRIPTSLLELFICHPTACCGKCGNCCYGACNCCTSAIGLVRTDSYSYINLFGTTLCDSSRECEKLCIGSGHFQGFQSPMRNFRILAGITIVALALFFVYPILNYRVTNIGFWFLVDLIVFITAVMSFFASIHPSAGEGIQTSFLVENHLSGGYDYMQYCIPVIYYLFSRLERNYTRSRDLKKGTEIADKNCLFVLFSNINSVMLYLFYYPFNRNILLINYKKERLNIIKFNPKHFSYFKKHF